MQPSTSGAQGSPEVPPIIDEAMKKAPVAWLSVPGGPEGYPVWCLWIAGALYVVSGPGEQPAPGLAGAASALVTVRGDHGGRIVTWPAGVSRLEPDAPEWAELATQLAGKRLNASGGTAEMVERWATTCVVSRLVPAGLPTEAGSTLPDTSASAPPRPTPAATRTAAPFRLHRVRKRGS